MNGDVESGAPRVRELSSWKEIASYLRVGVRTAQIWERERGLPVHRIPGPRGRVLATVEELDAWKHSGAGIDTPPDLPTNRRSVTGVIAAACLVPIALAVLIMARYWVAPGVPASYRLDPYGLTVLDSKGQTLWRSQFSTQLALAAYEARNGNDIWIGDLDGDGHREVLFVQMSGDPAASTPLICYSDRGVERWRFTPGRKVRSNAEEFTPVYAVRQFVVASLGRRRPTTILVTSSHSMYYPAQVALLSSGGIPLREYWHSGHLPFIEIADLNGDGTDEIYLAGISNGWKAATLVVLDPDRFGGASEEAEAPDHQLLGFSPGVERARVILPRSCLNRAIDPYNGVLQLVVVPGEIIVETEELLSPAGDGVFNHFTGDLGRHRVVLSDSYRIDYRKMAPALHGCRADDISGMRILR